MLLIAVQAVPTEGIVEAQIQHKKDGQINTGKLSMQ